MSNPVALGPFPLGMNNRLPDTHLSTKDGAFLRNAVNVDLTPAGTVQRRAGTTKRVSGSDCHSFWSNGAVGYYVDYDTLYCLRPGAEPAVVLTGRTPGVRLSYTQTPNEILVSTGSDLWCLDGTTATPFGLEPPRYAPLLTTDAGGALPGGKYQVAIAYVSESGEVSGTTVPVSVEVPDNGVLRLFGLSTTQPCVVYLTHPNGDEFFRAAAVQQAVLSFATMPSLGARCQTLLLRPTPAGSIVRHHNGRLLAAVDNLLYYSEPYALALHNPQRGYIPFPAPITMVEPCQNGCYVSADQTYWVAGEISQAELTPVLPYQAVAGTSGTVPNASSVWWMSERGVVLGTPDGQVQNLQEQHIVVDPALVGASLYREQDGLKQMVASLFNPQQTVAAARTFMDAEIVRQGDMQ